MKLDKIAFAKLIGYLGRQFAISFDEFEMRTLDDLIDIPVPVPEPVVVPKASCYDVDTLLSHMGKDGYKIEAIKTYRVLTGAGLKESKDAVERYWPSKSSSIGDILPMPKKTAVAFCRELTDSIYDIQNAVSGSEDSRYHILRHFTHHELQKFREFINSFEL